MVSKQLVISQYQHHLNRIHLFQLFFLLTTLLGCNPNNPTPNPPTIAPVQTSWTLNYDGVVYSWSGSYECIDGEWYQLNQTNSPVGSCVWNLDGGMGNGGVVTFGKAYLPGSIGNDLTCHFYFYPNNTGSFQVNNTSLQNQINPCALDLKISEYPLVDNIFVVSWIGATCPNLNSNLNITEFSSLKGGLVKGNFNGTWTDNNGIAHSISGDFKAIRQD